MRKYSYLAGCAFLAASAGTAMAGPCADEIASLSAGTGGSAAMGEPTGSTSAGGTSSASGGISKDGSTAPLSSPDQSASSGAGGSATTSSTGAAASGQAGIAKDGSTAPLSAEGHASTGVATSPQDMRAQQQGEPTAAAQASGEGNSEMMAKLDEARSLDAQGDEEGCMSAVEEARRLQSAQ